MLPDRPSAWVRRTFPPLCIPGCCSVPGPSGAQNTSLCGAGESVDVGWPGTKQVGPEETCDPSGPRRFTRRHGLHGSDPGLAGEPTGHE